LTYDYVSMSVFLASVDKLFQISKLPRWQANELIKEIVDDKESGTTFDTSILDLNERLLEDYLGVRVTPLVHNPGRLVLTNKSIYFQPMNNINPNPVEKFPFSMLIRVIKRRHSLRQVGLEIFLEDDNHNMQSVFFCFSYRDYKK